MNLNPTCRHQGVSAAVVLAAAALWVAPAARADFPLPLPHELHQELRAHAHDVLRSIGRIPQHIYR